MRVLTSVVVVILHEKASIDAAGTWARAVALATTT